MLDHMMEYNTTYSREIEGPENYSNTSSPSSSSAMMIRSPSKKNKNRNNNNNNNNNTRRFSDEQIKSLETMFETETRLEPRKKLQLAKELGLQPRQVAIWFQNKRARWKSKQLERDYSILRNNYNNLASRFESLKKEKQTLLIQLQKLKDLIQKPLEQTQSSTQAIKDSESENGDTTKSEPEPHHEMKTSPSSIIIQRLSSEHHHVLGCRGGGLSDDDTSIKVEYFGNMEDDEPGLLNFGGGGDGSLTSPEDWRGTTTFESDHGLLSQSTSDYQWWDFWS